MEWTLNPMRSFLIRLFSTVQLTRLTNAFAGVANLWFVALWTRSSGDIEHRELQWIDWPLPIVLGVTAVLGISVSMYAGAVNDVFDVRRDRVFSPQRPIPSGRISVQGAAMIGFASLLLSMLSATMLGTPALLMCLLCAAAILLYNTTTRHVPSIGLLSVGIIYGSHMLMANLGFRFIWPVLLIMAHTIIVHAAVYRLVQKRPKFTWLTVAGTTLGYSLLVILMIWQTGHHGITWDHAVYPWYALTFPLAAVCIFAVSTHAKAKFASSPMYAAEKLERYGSLWMGIYGVCWLAGASKWVEALILAGLVLLGILWMLFVRDLGAWIDQPVGYRL